MESIVSSPKNLSKDDLSVDKAILTNQAPPLHKKNTNVIDQKGIKMHTTDTLCSEIPVNTELYSNENLIHKDQNILFEKKSILNTIDHDHPCNDSPVSNNIPCQCDTSSLLNGIDTASWKSLEETSNNHGFVFWRNILKKARYVVAPMVDASELPWRLLSRRYGAELCYTPMLHSGVLTRDWKYRRDNFATCPQDKPLIVQLCASDPEILADASRLSSPHCDAIDLNLGCPQSIAKKGRYGAFLMEDLSLVRRMVEGAVAASAVPVTVKMRIFPCVKKTLQYARMLEEAGASVITVHARIREQKGPCTGMADWSYITAIRGCVRVPVFANGNIQNLADVWRCIGVTGVQGVMSAETNLHDPSFFAGPDHFKGTGAPTVWQMALEYLDLVAQFPCPVSYARGHMFKLMHHCLQLRLNSEVRKSLSRTNSIAEMRAGVEAVRANMMPYVESTVPCPEDWPTLPLPPWLCQPYVRIPPEEHKKRLEQGMKGENKRPLNDADRLCFTQNVSKKKAKRLLKNPREKLPKADRCAGVLLCPCLNPRGMKCSHVLCRSCCRARCYEQKLECAGHRVSAKTRGDEARSEAVRLDTNEEIKSVQDEMETNERPMAENESLNVKEGGTVEIVKSTGFDSEHIGNLNHEKNSIVAGENQENLIIEIKGNNYDSNKELQS